MAGLRQPTKRDAIKAQIVRWIREQGLQPGDRILSQNQLAASAGVTAVTVHKAMTELVAAGVLYRRQGQGTFVGPHPGSQRTRQVCLVLPGEHLNEPAYNPFYWPYVQALYRAFLDSVGERFVFTTRSIPPEVDPATVAGDFGDYHAVFFHHTREPRRLLEHLVRREVAPVVAFGLPQPWVRCLTVDHEMTEGTRRAICWLHGQGYRRIAMVASDRPWVERWLAGYRQGLADCGLAFDPGLLVRPVEGPTLGNDAARELLRRGLPCDAVYTVLDMHALHLIETLTDAGVSIPGDIGVMGYDGLDLATRHPPYLTSFSIPHTRMVAAALEAIEGLSGRRSPHRHLGLVGEVLPGRTTRPLRTGSATSP